MVPCERILEEAVRTKATIIGLSGLITPSLHEMVHVAKEMQRLEIEMPLLIGGATTSRTHTAVKIAPVFEGSTVHVLDASRAPGVVRTLLSDALRSPYLEELESDYERLRKRHAQKGQATLTAWSKARANPLPFPHGSDHIVKPKRLGVHPIPSPGIATLRKYIDWTPFFHTWELKGSYPKILEDSLKGEHARELLADANQLLDQWETATTLQPKGVFGLFAASSSNEGIDLSDQTGQMVGRLEFLRQQTDRNNASPHLSLADYVAPKDSGISDYMGMFAVTAGIESDNEAKKAEQDGDDYTSIMMKAVADRLAEAFAEWAHEMIRKEAWGYAPEETLTNEELIRLKYRGIRPAPGYPACPDHTEKEKIWKLLRVEEHTGMTLTESFAMYPAASVSGYYFAHPESRYFGLGSISKEQAADYSTRKNQKLAETEKWLAPNLGYTPSSD